MFIVATGCYLIGQAVYGPIIGSADFLELAYPQRSRVIGGILVELVGVLAIPLIALLFYPVLRRHHHASALTYVGIRLLESVALLVVTIIAWASVAMSGHYLLGDAATAAQWRVVGGALQAVSESAFLISVGAIFPLGAFVLNSILWRSRLVPRLIAGWGLAGAVLLLAGSLLDFFEVLPAAPAVVLEAGLAGPIAVQEMALAAWLIVKGFTTPDAPVQITLSNDTH
jgi:hypothetical protein